MDTAFISFSWCVLILKIYFQKSSSETDLYQGTERLGVLQSEICDDSESIHSTTDMSETASQDDFINSQGVRFMPHSHSKEGL